jgi:hypothetical protein
VRFYGVSIGNAHGHYTFDEATAVARAILFDVPQHLLGMKPMTAAFATDIRLLVNSANLPGQATRRVPDSLMATDPLARSMSLAFPHVNEARPDRASSRFALHTSFRSASSISDPPGGPARG